jgi:hypothetical protein
MTETKDNLVKILFRFFSDVLDEWTIETMWAEIVDMEKGLYKIDNIPFYASVASGDIVFAEFDETEQILTYRETKNYSGNSTIQVVIMNKQTEANEIRDVFTSLGCVSEKLNEGYFTMEISFDKDYTPIRKKLIELEENEIIAYAEPCLSDIHQY